MSGEIDLWHFEQTQPNLPVCGPVGIFIVGILLLYFCIHDADNFMEPVIFRLFEKDNRTFFIERVPLPT